MTLPSGIFYTYKDSDHCLREVVGQSRAAIAVNENVDGTFDAQVVTNGPGDGFHEGLLWVQGVKLQASNWDDPVEPGTLSFRRAPGSTAKERDELAKAKAAAEEAARKAAKEAAAIELAAPKTNPEAVQEPAQTAQTSPES